MVIAVVRRTIFLLYPPMVTSLDDRKPSNRRGERRAEETWGGLCQSDERNAAEAQNFNGAIEARFRAWSGVTLTPLVSAGERTSRLRE